MPFDPPANEAPQTKLPPPSRDAKKARKNLTEVQASEKVQNVYKQLSRASINLNAASDALGDAISLWDAALEKLNLNISSWVMVSGHENGPEWWSRDIGYTQVGDKWGIALRTATGDNQNEKYDSVQVWLFNKAPRWMRIEAVSKLPDVLEVLLRLTEDTTKSILKKTQRAYELGIVIKDLTEVSEPSGQHGQKLNGLP